MTVTPEELAKWKALAEGATPGERKARRGAKRGDPKVLWPDVPNAPSEVPPHVVAETRDEQERRCIDYVADVHRESDAEFMAAARDAVPRLVAEVERLKAEAKEAAWNESEAWMEAIGDLFPDTHPHDWQPKDAAIGALGCDTTKPFHARWPNLIRAWVDEQLAAKDAELARVRSERDWLKGWKEGVEEGRRRLNPCSKSAPKPGADWLTCRRIRGHSGPCESTRCEAERMDREAQP